MKCLQSQYRRRLVSLLVMVCLVSFADQSFDQQYLWAFAQIVRACLETKPEHADLLLAPSQNGSYCPFDVFYVAR